MKFYDTHSNTVEEKEMIKIQFEDGRQGVAVYGNYSSINEYNFVTDRLSQSAIGGVINTKDQSLEDAVAEYNGHEESGIKKPNRIKHAVLA